MKLLDLNVVYAASRDDHPHHTVARDAIDALLATREPFLVPIAVAVGFVRLATSRSPGGRPMTVAQAFAFLDALTAQPGARVVAGGADHLRRLRDVCDAGHATGPLVSHAHLAALAIEHGAELVSFDRDFARFPGLRWTTPLSG